MHTVSLHKCSLRRPLPAMILSNLHTLDVLNYFLGLDRIFLHLLFCASLRCSIIFLRLARDQNFPARLKVEVLVCTQWLVQRHDHDPTAVFPSILPCSLYYSYWLMITFQVRLKSGLCLPGRGSSLLIKFQVKSQELKWTAIIISGS